MEERAALDELDRTNGLGRLVYIGLGVGMVVGIGTATVSMVADRMAQAWSESRTQRVGQ